MQGEEERFAVAKRCVADQQRILRSGIRCRQQLRWVVPTRRVCHGQFAPGRNDARDRPRPPFHAKSVACHRHDIAGALRCAELEKFSNRLRLAADVTIATPLHPVHTAERPDEFRCGFRPAQLCADNHSLRLSRRQRGQVQHAFTEQRIANLVQDRTGPVDRHDLRGIVQPFHARAGSDSEPQVAPAPRQVERELRLVPAIHPERRTAAVKRTVEKLGAIRDDEVRADRRVAKRACDVVRQKNEGLTPLGRGQLSGARRNHEQDKQPSERMKVKG